MTFRRVFPITLLVMFTLIWANIVMAFSAANTMPSSHLTRYRATTTPNDFLPTECQGRVSISMIATTSNPLQPALILGTAGNDNLNGGGGPDCIVGGGGDDTLAGGAGTTVFLGGPGNDTINGGNGTDYLYGGDGDDILNGGRGNDYLYGEAGNDTLNGNQNTDTCDGGSGTDSATQCETTINVP
jgi:Ca2+-binding RTX toxin-like protein